MTSYNRNKPLDIARGISIFLIVLSHSYCTWQYLFAFFYVQVFFFLSGVFFNHNQTLENSFYKKTKGLIFPYLFFGFICSLLVLLSGRNSIENLHIYDPDSFDNGPLWFLISLYTAFIILFSLNQFCKRKLITIVISSILFIISYYLGLNKIDDYTNFTKATLCIPFILMGSYYLSFESYLKRYKFPLFVISILGCLIFVYVFHINIGLRWLILPDNPTLFIFSSIIGILLIISLSNILERIRFINISLSFWGMNSLFILCIHWPIVRIIYDNFIQSHIKSNFISIIFSIIVCYVTSFIGVFLKKYLKQIF